MPFVSSAASPPEGKTAIPFVLFQQLFFVQNVGNNSGLLTNCVKYYKMKTWLSVLCGVITHRTGNYDLL